MSTSLLKKKCCCAKPCGCSGALPTCWKVTLAGFTMPSMYINAHPGDCLGTQTSYPPAMSSLDGVYYVGNIGEPCGFDAPIMDCVYINHDIDGDEQYPGDQFAEVRIVLVPQGSGDVWIYTFVRFVPYDVGYLYLNYNDTYFFASVAIVTAAEAAAGGCFSSPIEMANQADDTGSEAYANIDIRCPSLPSPHIAGATVTIEALYTGCGTILPYQDDSPCVSSPFP